MLDFGWSELFLIIILGVILMGPKDIPEILYNLGRMARRLQYMKFALTRQFDAFMEEAELNELRKGASLGDIYNNPLRGRAMPSLPSTPVTTMPKEHDTNVVPAPPTIDPLETEDDEAFFAGIAPIQNDLFKDDKHDKSPAK